MSKYNRLNGCKNLIPLMYKKRSFTTPTVNKVFSLKNGKEIEIGPLPLFKPNTNVKVEVIMG